MSGTLSLLSMTHAQAIRVMVQDKLVPGVSVSDLVIETPQSASGLDMTSKVYISASAYENPNWPYYGDVDFTYTALDMGDTFAGIPLAFIMPREFTSQQLAAKVGEALQLRFEPNDVITETITQTTQQMVYTLQASARSPRWKGSVDIAVYNI